MQLTDHVTPLIMLPSCECRIHEVCVCVCVHSSVDACKYVLRVQSAMRPLWVASIPVNSDIQHSSPPPAPPHTHTRTARSSAALHSIAFDPCQCQPLKSATSIVRVISLLSMSLCAAHAWDPKSEKVCGPKLLIGCRLWCCFGQRFNKEMRSQRLNLRPGGLYLYNCSDQYFSHSSSVARGTALLVSHLVAPPLWSNLKIS